jgi:hypothetical protein
MLLLTVARSGPAALAVLLTAPMILVAGMLVGGGFLGLMYGRPGRIVGEQARRPLTAAVASAG